ncbi:hypothetical protein KR479_29835, partial [Escherichia coli]|nr:hypothetical protein [Escherichia coli]
MQTTRTPYSISFMATVLLLLLFACHSTVANAAVALGATRVIYPANQKQVGFAPIFPDTCYHLTHYWPAAADIPVASDNPVHYADAIRYNAR